MKEIYIVMGESGYYPEDKMEWIVQAFTSEEEANEVAKNAQEYADRFLKDLREAGGPHDPKTIELVDNANQHNPYDETKRFSCYDSGHEYYEYSVSKTLLKGD